MEDERQIFNKDMVDKGIEAVCDAMDGLDLTLFERWHVLRCLEASARAILGENVVRFVEEEEKRRSEAKEMES